MIISEVQKELLVAYMQFIEVGHQYLAGKGRFRPRVEEAALDALQQSMQYSLKRLLRVAVVAETRDSITLRLPARGRIGRSKIVSTPRFAIGAGPTALLVEDGQRNLVRDLDEMLIEHTIQLNGNSGEVPLFGDLIPFELGYSLR